MLGTADFTIVARQFCNEGCICDPGLEFCHKIDRCVGVATDNVWMERTPIDLHVFAVLRAALDSGKAKINGYPHSAGLVEARASMHC